MKTKIFSIINLLLTIIVATSIFGGCSSTNTSQYAEEEFIGVWMTEEDIEKLNQMTDFQKYNSQSMISSMRICDDNVVLYTPTYTNSATTHNYHLKGDSIVVTSQTLARHSSSGKNSSSKKTFDISLVNGSYELESDGEKYIKVCSDPYEYDVAKFLK